MEAGQGSEAHVERTFEAEARDNPTNN